MVLSYNIALTRDIFIGVRSLTVHAQQVQVNLLVVGFQWAKHFLAYTCSELG